MGTKNTSIKFTNGDYLIIDVPPVLSDDAYMNIYGYPVKATFDLSKVPKEYHEITVRMIQMGSHNLIAPLCNDCQEEEKDDSYLGKLWQKLFS